MSCTAASKVGVAFALKTENTSAACEQKEGKHQSISNQTSASEMQVPQAAKQRQGASEHKNPLANKRTAAEKMKPCFYEG
jgi:hypothetical protein